MNGVSDGLSSNIAAVEDCTRASEQSAATSNQRSAHGPLTQDNWNIKVIGPNQNAIQDIQGPQSAVRKETRSGANCEELGLWADGRGEAILMQQDT